MRATLIKIGAVNLLLAALGMTQLNAQFLEARDVGDNPRGSIQTNGPGSYTIVGGGHEPWGNSDDYFFAYQPISGDFDVQVKVEWLESTGRWSKAGIMARPSMNYRTAHTYVRETPTGPICPDPGLSAGNDICMSGRRGDGDHAAGATSEWDDGCTGKPGVSNNWVRLVRTGAIISAYSGTDGATWALRDTEDTATYVGQYTGVGFANRILVGLATSRHNDGGACLTARAEYRNYEFNSLNVAQVSSRGNPNCIYVHFTRPVSASALDAGNYAVSSALGLTYAPGTITYHPSGDQKVVVLDVSPEAGGVDPLAEGDTVTVAIGNPGVGGGIVDQSTPPRTLVGQPVTVSFVHGAGYEMALVHEYMVNETLPDSTNYNATTWTYGLDLYRASSLYGQPAADNRATNTLFEQTFADSIEGFNLRMVALINPPADGDYTFAVSSDDSSYIYLSSDDQPIKNGVLICREPAWNGYRQYVTGDNQASRGTPPANISGPQALKAGEYRALDMIMNEGCCGNPGSATWVKPGDPALANGQLPIGDADLVPTRFFANSFFYNLGPVVIAKDLVALSAFETLTATFSVGVDGTPPYTFQWYKNGVPIPNSNSRYYTTPPTSMADDGTVYKVCVVNEVGLAAGEVCSAEAVLTVVPVPIALSASSRGNCHGIYVKWTLPVQLNGVYDVLSSNTVDGVTVAMTVGDLGYAGDDQTSVFVPLSPDLVPDTYVYYITVSGVLGQNGNPQLNDPVTFAVVHGAEYPFAVPANGTVSALVASEFDGGIITWRQWNGLNLQAGGIPTFMTDPRYLTGTPPPDLDTTATAFETPGWENGVNYGGELKGTWIVPRDDTYTFWCSSDDQSIVYIATDNNPANIVPLCREPEWANQRAYTNARNDAGNANRGVPPLNGSKPYVLTAGQMVYLQGDWIEGDGGDGLSVTYSTQRRAPNGCIFMTLCDVFCATPPTDQTVAENMTATFTVVADGTPAAAVCYYYQWKKDGVDIPGATAASYTTPPVSLADNAAVFTVEVRNDFSSSTCSAVLHVLPNPRLLSCATANQDVNRVYVTFNKDVLLNGVYEIDGGLILAMPVAYGGSSNIVVLQTDPFEADVVHTLVVSAVTDPDSNVMIPDPAQCTFQVTLGRFCTDFSGGVPAGTTVSGTRAPAVGAEGALHLTDFGITGEINFWTIPIVPQTLPSLKATWKTYLNGVGMADGGSFNVGNGPFTYGGGVPEQGATTGLSIVVDTYDNACVNGGEEGFYIKWNGTTLGYTQVPTSCNAGASPAINTGTWVDTSVEVTPSGAVTYKHGLFVVTAQIPGFTGIPANRYEFGARTGGVAEDYWIDDVCINDFVLGPVAGTVTPAVAEVYETLTATFTANATGSPWLTYQWQLNDVDIPGATAATYTTAPITAANEGDRYTAVVANGFSSAILGPGVISVKPGLLLLSCSTMGDPNKLYVTFNKAVGLTGSYDIEIIPGAVNGATLLPGRNDVVVVDTEGIPQGGTYTLTVSGETGSDGSPMVPDPSTCTFVQLLYCADFEDGQLPAGTIASGTPLPYVLNGVLHMTDNGVNSAVNYWTIPVPSQTFPGFRAQWKTQLGPADSFGGRADGFSFNVGNNLGTTFTPEEGAGNGLSVTVDTYNNGNAEVGLEIRWNGLRQSFLPIAGGTAPPELMKGQFVDASVDVTGSGFVTFKYDTFVTTAQLPGYTGIAANQYVFAARTGGANEDCWIDDLCVYSYPLGDVSATVVPAALSVIEGRPATFTATASGLPPYTYQWLRDGVEIPGAVNPIYSFLTVAGDDGAVFTVQVTDKFGGTATSDGAVLTVLPVPTEYGMGGLLFEVYYTPTNGNTTVDSLRAESKFPNYPDARYYLPRFDTRAVYPDNTHEWYGGRISGLFYPPTSGNWVFYLSSDDSSELWLNPAGTDPAGKIRILNEPTCCRAPSAIYTTNAIPLVAGEGYYIEGLYKEGGGGDYMQVYALPEGEVPPIDPLTQSIQGAYLAALIDPTANASVAITTQPVNACAILQPPSPPQTLLSADFNTSDGGFWATNFGNDTTGALPLGPFSWNGTTAWSCWDLVDCGSYPGPYASGLVSPPVVLSSAGGISLKFSHRYSSEGGAWDGGIVLLSVNGGAWNVVMPANFTANGYNGTILGDTVGANMFKGAPAFVNDSPGYATPTYLVSEAGLGFFNAGDVLVVGFLYTWDQGCSGSTPNWEIDNVEVSIGAQVPVSASFTVGASGLAYGASVQPAYQWQRNTGGGFVNIPGANASTYTAAGVQLTDSGTLFRVVARVPGANATSAEATLTAIAGCGGIVVTRDDVTPAVIITWNSVTWEVGQYCVLQGAVELVDGGPGTVWVTIQASDPDVISLTPGQAVLRPSAPYKFFRTASPLSCP